MTSSSIGQGGIEWDLIQGQYEGIALSCIDSPLGWQTLTSVGDVTVEPETNSTLFAFSSPDLLA